MNKHTILKELRTCYTDFMDYIRRLDKASFSQAPEGKWTPGQQLEHLNRSIAPLKMAFGLPKFVPRILYGKSNNKSRSYQDVVNAYLAKIQAGAGASKAYIPPTIGFEKKNQLLDKMQEILDAMIKKIGAKYSEEDLDYYLLPHPLIGKLTVREMLYFTIYHVQHHLKSVKSFKGLI